MLWDGGNRGVIANRKRSSFPVGCAILSIDRKEEKKPNRALFRAHHSFQREMSLSCFFSTVSHLENSFNIHTEIEFPRNSPCKQTTHCLDQAWKTYHSKCVLFQSTNTHTFFPIEQTNEKIKDLLFYSTFSNKKDFVFMFKHEPFSKSKKKKSWTLFSP